MRKKTKSAFRLLLAIFFVYLCYSHLSTVLDVSQESFTNENYCPACYGKTLCPKFHSGQLELLSWSKLKALQVLNGKNVYYALLDQEELVVKKLAHTSELNQVDERLCSSSGRDPHCDAGSTLLSIIDSTARVSPHNVATLLSNLTGHFNTDLFRCPSPRLFDHLVKSCLKMEVRQNPGLLREHFAMVVYTAMINPEPLILQMFPPSEGWLFPDLRGFCGRTSVVEYAGRMLSEYEDSPWRQRVELAVQLLRLAHQMTDNAQDFALYMTDVNMHNFAVDEEGTLKLIDLENIIVVDKRKIRKEKALGWDEPYVNMGMGCPDCLSFSVNDLCTHEVSDHNYYAVCRGILSAHSYYSQKGFLHDIHQAREGSRIHDLLQKCARPTHPTERLDVVHELTEALEALIY